MTIDVVRKLRASSPVLAAIVGFRPEDERDVQEMLPANSLVVDLDVVDPGTPLDDPVSGIVVVLARTLTDLRRGASLAGVLPRSSRVLIAVAAPGPDQRPALLAASPDWRMTSFSVEHGSARGWSVEAVF